METLKYKIITSDKQYDKYADILESLVFSSRQTKQVKDEIDLLTLLIEKYDEEHNIFNTLDPVEILISLMKDHNLKSIDLAIKLHVSPGLISDIINYKKGMSKEVIRKLADYFKVYQEAFNRPYKLIITKKANPTNTRKRVAAA